MPKKGKVLLIEDDQLMVKLYRIKLDLEGYDVTVATTGSQGLKSASSDLPDVILLDIVMPGMDGYEVLRRLKKNRKTKDIPVLILTNLTGEEEEVQKAIRLGAQDFIKKSGYTMRGVVAKVQSALKKSAKGLSPRPIRLWRRSAFGGKA